MVRYLKGKNPLKSNPEEDIDIESDYEGESLQVEDELQDAGEEKEEQSRAVLVTGSFATCVHIVILPLYRGESRVLQLEISVLLSLHRRDIFRSPQVSRCRLPPELHPRKHCGGCTPSLLSEDYLRFSQLGEAISTSTSHTRLTRGIKLEMKPLCASALADVKGKLSSDNVADEVFSWVTGR